MEDYIIFGNHLIMISTLLTSTALFLALGTCFGQVDVRVTVAPIPFTFHINDPIASQPLPPLNQSKFVYRPQKDTVLFFPSGPGIPFGGEQVVIYNKGRTRTYNYYHPNNRSMLMTQTGWVLQQFLIDND